jgi:hypothetical protein
MITCNCGKGPAAKLSDIRQCPYREKAKQPVFPTIRKSYSSRITIKRVTLALQI